MRENPVCHLFGIRYPIVQGGMLGVSCPELAAAISNAGGLGVLSGVKPVNELRSVYGTPLDYRQSAAIRPRLVEDDEQIRLDRGYQHIWRLDKSDGPLTLAARLYEPTTKRVLEIRTTALGMWFETGNFMDGKIVGKGNTVYERHSGLTLAAHSLSPDPASSADFPSIAIRPGETYKHTTVYKFFAL